MTAQPLAQVDPTLREWFLSACDWPEAVLPAYQGGSVANAPATVLRTFGVDAADTLPPISADLLPPDLLTDARVVVLLVIDGYARHLHDRLGAALQGLDPHQSTLTSVVPSTTAAALTSLQTGVGPATHGMVGYTIYLPAMQRIANLIAFAPVDNGGFDPNVLDPHQFLPVPTVYERIRHAGIDSVVVSKREFKTSALTQVHSRDVRYVGYGSLGEFGPLVLREIPQRGRRFIFAYWDGVDLLGHRWGPDSPAEQAEIEALTQHLQQYLLAPLAALGQDVAVLVTADHGMTRLDRDTDLTLNELSKVTGPQAHAPTGERRAAGFALTPRQFELLRSGTHGRGVLLPTEQMLAAGLMGPGTHHLETAQRIGTGLLFARDHVSFPFVAARGKPDTMAGAHGSLTAEEMLVPLLVWRFRDR